MNWCKYHGILTPASLVDAGDPVNGIKYCGYEVSGPEGGCCTARTYNLETWEIDLLDEAAQGLQNARKGV